MDAPILLHDAGPSGAKLLQYIPASVRALDAVCNARIADAQTVDGLNTELRRKLAIKRLLVGLSPADLEHHALAHLALLEQGDGR